MGPLIAIVVGFVIAAIACVASAYTSNHEDEQAGGGGVGSVDQAVNAYDGWDYL
jgi:hypothetical protein